MQKRLISLCRQILSDTNTRNLLFFLLLNLVMAFVELLYGLWTNSLGLISDSFHMFFDCSALLLGLAASLVSKWRPNEKFTYGFGRAEILAGLANGLFLLFIALFIMKEAIERTFEPPEVHHERLFVISVLGFIVNLVGIFVFQHGGQHGSCSHSHSHSHSHSKHDHHHHHDHNNHDHHIHHHNHHAHDNNHNSHGYSHYSSPNISVNNNHQQATGAVTLDMANGYSQTTIAAANYNNHQNHYYDSSLNEPLIEPANGITRPKSSARGQIMQSVFLHIVADTLGSVGVMVSAVLMSQFGLLIADPLCSLFIAILISISVYPLLRDSIYVLMQRVPVEIEGKLPGCLDKIQSLHGVVDMPEQHFWTLNSDTYIGCLKLVVSQGADHKHILTNARNLLTHIGVEKVNIQIEHL